MTFLTPEALRHRAVLAAEAAAYFDKHRPASRDNRAAYIASYVEIAGFRTPACPARKALEMKHG